MQRTMTVSQDDYPVVSFASADAFEKWLITNAKQAGVWLKIAKKGSGIASVTYDEALDVALCHGWIDGLKRTYDQNYFLQKFTPRRPKSLWSKRNIDKVTALVAAGRMQPAGMAEIEAAKRDGRWDAAYDSPANMPVPDDFLRAVASNKKTQEFYNTLNKTNTYAIAFRLATAKKPETRQRRFDTLLAMLERGEKLH